MAGRVVHFEVPYDDAARARAFYAEVFGRAIESMPEFDYDFVQTGPIDVGSGMPGEPGYIGGGMFQCHVRASTERGRRIVMDAVTSTLRHGRLSMGTWLGPRSSVLDRRSSGARGCPLQGCCR